MKLSVIIPALNEEEGIGGTLDEIKKSLDGRYEYEIVVVDDGSKDRTGDIAKSKGARVIRHPVNKGYGAAIKTAVEGSRYDTICLLDADATYPSPQIPDLMDAFTGDGCIVSGSRFMGKNMGMPIIRKIGNKFFVILASTLMMHRISDISSGMKIFTKKTFNDLQPLPDDLDMIVVMTLRTLKRKMKFVEIPIEYRGRMGSSKLSAVREGFRFLRTIIHMSLFGG